MKIYSPDNIFTRTIFSTLSKNHSLDVQYLAASLISKSLNEGTQTIALIPTLELITNKNLKISRSFGLSFDGMLCNSYIYFNAEQEEVGKINISGDVSSTEVIVSKILFKELYNTDVELNVTTESECDIDGTHILVGDANFQDAKFEGGLSIAEEVVQLISAPYVTYVLASSDEELIINWADKILPDVSEIEFPMPGLADGIDEESKIFIKENSSHLYLNFEDQDIVGINELIRMTYYHGIIEDLFEVNFVKS